MKLLYVAGARPNFMKIAPIMENMGKHTGVSQILVHTGQHYDNGLSRVFFDELGIPEPDIHLGVGSASHAVQTAKIMTELEPILLRERPHWLMVVGDVNSTLAASLTASKAEVRIAHVEAGLRSFDRSMPEEINRIVTDAVADLLFTTEPSANENLRREGVSEEKIAFVGNVMIDTLIKFRDKSRKSDVLERLKLEPHGYALLTLHRPSNVDEPDRFRAILNSLAIVAGKIPLIFSCHPRTRSRIQMWKLESYFRSPGESGCGITLVEPLGYLDFLCLMSNAKLVLTDSGGIQEETTVLGIPCLTLRRNTERPVTVSHGTNTLVGQCQDRIISEVSKILANQGKKWRIPELWDGQAAARAVEVLLRTT